MKIAILGGYGPKQSVGAVYRAFQRAGHDVRHVQTFPAFMPWFDDVDLLFTFKIGLGNVPAGYIKNLPIKTKIFWSFDDPHWIKYHASSDEVRWAREHDICLTSCLESVDTYNVQGMKAFFMPPAMDVAVYGHLQVAERHLTSFICTNLYPRRVYPDNFLDRGEMIDRLTATFGEQFALYGFNPEIEAKPACRGQVQWEDTLPEAIHATRMNISNHAYNKDKLYFNERFFQIVSTGQAMFCDRVSGFTDIFGEDDEHFIWYSSLDELVEKLLYYKDRGNDLIATGFRGLDRLGNWTYDAFVRQVLVAAEGGTPRVSFL
jgi:hypothetical protein